jgi:hypothetical protein
VTSNDDKRVVDDQSIMMAATESTALLMCALLQLLSSSHRREDTRVTTHLRLGDTNGEAFCFLVKLLLLFPVSSWLTSFFRRSLLVCLAIRSCRPFAFRLHNAFGGVGVNLHCVSSIEFRRRVRLRLRKKIRLAHRAICSVFESNLRQFEFNCVVPILMTLLCCCCGLVEFVICNEW